MDIIAITVCVNYDDIFKHMVKQNLKFFKKWYIITKIEDTATIKLITELNNPSIEILYYNDFYKNSKINKGGALNFSQEYVDKHYTNANILILDADIYLPDNFIQALPDILQVNTIYGTCERLDYKSMNNLIKNISPFKYGYGDGFAGFFQLYKQCSYKYENSLNCSECDIKFRDKFLKKHYLNLSVKHLGVCEVNWNGRDYTKGTY